MKKCKVYPTGNIGLCKCAIIDSAVYNYPTIECMHGFGKLLGQVKGGKYKQYPAEQSAGFGGDLDMCFSKD